MKIATFLLALLLTGCVSSPTSPPAPTPLPAFPTSANLPPAPPPVKARRAALASTRSVTSNGLPVIPSWTLTNLNGAYQVDVSTNLTNWSALAVVYYTTNLTLESDTLNTQPMLFYRISPATQ